MRLHQLSRMVLILSFGLVLISCSNEDNSSSSTTDTFDAKKYALVDLHLHLNGSLSPEEVIEMGVLGYSAERHLQKRWRK